MDEQNYVDLSMTSDQQGNADSTEQTTDYLKNLAADFSLDINPRTSHGKEPEDDIIAPALQKFHDESGFSVTTDDYHDLLKQAEALVKQGKLEQAESRYQILLKAMPEAPDVLTAVVLLRMQQGKTSEAETLMRKLLSQKTPQIKYIEALAQTFCDYQQFRICEQFLLEYLDRGIAASVPIYYCLGEALREQGKLRSAQIVYLLALHQSPPDLMFRLALLTLVSESNPVEKEIPYYQEAIDACLNGNVKKSIELIKESMSLSLLEEDQDNHMTDEAFETLLVIVKQSKTLGLDFTEFANPSGSADNPHNLIMLAKVKVKNGAPDEAMQMLKKALQENPDQVELTLYYSRLLEQDSLEKAIAYLSKNLRQFSHHFEVMAYYGKLQLLAKNEVKAIEALRRAYQLNSENVENNNHLITACQRTKNLSLAITLVQKNMDIEGQTPDTMLLMGTLLAKVGKVTDASTVFGAIVEIDPEDIRGTLEQAKMYVEHEMMRDALMLMRSVSSKSAAQSNIDFMYLYAQILKGDHQLTDASLVLKKAIKHHPDHTPCHQLLAEILLQLGEYVEAGRYYRELYKNNPDNPKLMVSLGEVYELSGDLHDAEELYQKAITQKPNFLQAKLLLAICQLRNENFVQGLEAYEMMSLLYPSKIKEVSNIPFWKGESLKGKHLLIYQNCTNSETILFARYFSYFQKMGARVTLLADPSLVRLLTPLVDICTATAPTADVSIPLSSVPKILNINLERIPKNYQYLAPDVSLLNPWERLLSGKRKMFVGLAWQSDIHSNDQKPYDRVSSISLLQFQPLLEKHLYDFVSLQLGEEGRQQEVAYSLPMRSGASLANDWSEIAAGISMMDVVVTNDQPVAHIAGALGIPTFVLLSSVAPWYWFIDHDRSPWYPSITILRQNMVGDWHPVMLMLEKQLEKLSQENR